MRERRTTTIDAYRTGVSRRLTDWLTRRPPRQARLLAAVVAWVSTIIATVATVRLATLSVTVTTWAVRAQTSTASGGGSGNTQQVQNAVCGTGLGPLLGIILILIALYLLIKAVIRGMIAFDKMGSARSDNVREGREQLKGSMLTVIGAMVPGVFLAILEVIGYPTISCISNNVQILAIVPF